MGLKNSWVIGFAIAVLVMLVMVIISPLNKMHIKGYVYIHSSSDSKKSFESWDRGGSHKQLNEESWDRGSSHMQLTEESWDKGGLHKQLNKNKTKGKVKEDRIELTLRMPATEKMVKRLMCDLLRSAVLFWDSQYGSFHIILDESDSKSTFFPQSLPTAGLPFDFRFTYEKEPSNQKEMKLIAKRINKPYGYIIQLYSSFLMDLYTNASIIAWTDSDTIFTQPVLRTSIKRNGKLLVKGMNTFAQFGWIADWDRTNINALGLPMVSDFMTYFPVYVYSSTIRNCREYILKRHNAVDQSFEHVFEKITTTYISPVSIIMSYAYYFERDRYSWHIDIGAPRETLERYNQQRLPKHPLTVNDISPELHQVVHTGYYQDLVNPLEKAICHVQIAIGMKNLTFCKQFMDIKNNQLLEFGNNPEQNHLKTWCHGEGRQKCDTLIQEQYSLISDLYKQKNLSFNTDLIKRVENLSQKDFGISCPSITYSKFITP